MVPEDFLKHRHTCSLYLIARSLFSLVIEAGNIAVVIFGNTAHPWPIQCRSFPIVKESEAAPSVPQALMSPYQPPRPIRSQLSFPATVLSPCRGKQTVSYLASCLLVF
ncbi:hypothetical protein K523DRAFT_94357 [Schizophyllum commune Tattone D]|nr:hypothetical protein K523DRAFT_94357 [Schizophyllum commune Tattone D]